TYLGIDLSSEAVEKAKSRGIKNARFKVADFEQWTPEENFDVVIFNESLSYARRPVDVLVRYAGLLDEDGFLIVSLCRYGNHGIIWPLASFWRETKDPEGVQLDSPGRKPWVQGPNCGKP